MNGISIARGPVVEAMPKTSFGELLSAELHPQIQQSFEYTVDNTDLTENETANGGTITQASGMAVLGTSTTTASTALLESTHHVRYRGGLGGLGRITALFTAGVADTEQYVGLMDEEGSSAAFENGFGVGFDGINFGVHRWRNDTKFSVNLADCDDPLDGTGPSGMTVDLTMLNVFQIKYQYLGAGPIRYFIEDERTGEFICFHTILLVNTETEPTIHNPNFHFIMWVNNGGTTSDIVLKSASYGYFTEGKTSFIEIHQPQNSSDLKSKATVTTEIAIFSIRVKTTYASKANYIDIVLESIMAQIEASSPNNLGSVRLIKNTTLGGTPVWNDINTNNSIVEIDVAGTTVTGGKTLEVVPLAGKNDKDIISLTEFKNILKHGDMATVAGLSVASATIQSFLLWRELF
ncbi:MAG: hypothetical protein KAJ07_00425 [Planctomycetes bacterium]|nr:hypothetical protein [Planctomycetota bacterium]